MYEPCYARKWYLSHDTKCNWPGKMLDLCFNFSLRNNMKFSPVKFICVIFKPNNCKLSFPNVALDSGILEYISQIKF